MKFRICLALIVAGFAPLSAQDKNHEAIESPFGTFVEEDFPFFSHTVDARQLGEAWPQDNLTPRGLVLNLGDGVHACFDPDLLRLSLVWKENSAGEYLEMTDMAPGSYRVPSQKASSGQDKLPKPIGTPLLANGIYPGWLIGEGKAKLEDPRQRSVDKDEIGLGPLPVEMGQFRRISFLIKASVSYFVGKSKVWDFLAVTDSGSGLVRSLTLEPHSETFTLVIGKVAEGTAVTASAGVELIQQDGVWLAKLPAADVESKVHIGFNSDLGAWLEAREQAKANRGNKTAAKTVAKASAGGVTVKARHSPIQTRWPEPVNTKSTLASAKNGLVRDDIGLPVPNPWKRNVRLSGFDFFSDGRAAVCTFDGDVWIVSGLEGDLEKVEWQRFTSGLHDPQALEIVDDEIYVFDRNGIWIIHGSTGENSRANVHEMFCNLVPQTAETREFAMDLYSKPGGGFYLAKGGQVGSTRGKLNGTVVEIAADGKSFKRIAGGFRMPYIGVDPLTGTVTASDQQGHWKPATPIYVVGQDEYYGFQPAKFGDKAVHPQAIDEPAVWIPHFVNQSGASQVWLRDAKMGPLNNSLLHIGYNRPELFKVYLDRGAEGDAIQGAVAPVMKGFGTGPLHGRVHSIDGSLYMAGFKIWGTVGEDISGLYRLRWSGGPNYVPREVRSDERGILMSFDDELDEAIATSLATYTVDRWNYLRSHEYGSGNYRLDGEPGQETLPVASAYLSKDRKSVFLGVPDMQPVHSMRLTYRVAANTEMPLIQNAYLTVHELRSIDLEKFGFPAALDVDLTVKSGAATDVAMIEPSVEEGRKTAELFGCVACHTTDGSRAVAADPTTVVGPTWKGLFGTRRDFSDGTFVKQVDKVYLRESIVDPGRKVAAGFETEKTGVGMPSYLGVLKDYQIDSILLYIESLADKKKAKK